jgi:hypothetical protein
MIASMATISLLASACLAILHVENARHLGLIIA